MTIQELARRAGVTPRTIRYYTEQGLLPQPVHGRPARYTEEHVRRLELIRRLKEQYLPLEEIRDTLNRLTPEQVEELVAGREARRVAEAPLSSAADYIAAVLGRGAAREHLKQQAGPAPEATPAQMPAAPAPTAPALPPAAAAPAPAPASFAVPPTKPAAPRRMAVREEAYFLGEEPHAAPEGVEATDWRRVTLAPGWELHYLASGDPRLERLAARIVEAARHLLEETPDYPTEEP